MGGACNWLHDWLRAANFNGALEYVADTEVCVLATFALAWPATLAQRFVRCVPVMGSACQFVRPRTVDLVACVPLPWRSMLLDDRYSNLIRAGTGMEACTVTPQCFWSCTVVTLWGQCQVDNPYVIRPRWWRKEQIQLALPCLTWLYCLFQPWSCWRCAHASCAASAPVSRPW